MILNYIFLNYLVFTIFFLIDAIDRSKIDSDQERIKFFISHYPFHFSRRLPLRNEFLNLNKINLKMVCAIFN